MAELQRHMFRHLRSAKVWLTRAEESFDKDSNIRGELDLFLAQAELQHARETHQSRQWRYKYPLIRHGLSLVLATSIGVVGFGAYWLASNQHVTEPSSPTVQEFKVIPVTSVFTQVAAEPKRIEEFQPEPVVVAAKTPAVAVASTPVEQQKTVASRPTEKDNLVPPDEMQKIIRAAGKSLRGQQ